MTSDLDLLRQFARGNSQDAFAEIVRRHLNLVYSAALRQVRSPQLAEEIAQSVFADLARVAATPSSPLRGGDASPHTGLTPWLYAVTRRTAIDAIRKESRRQLREQIAVEMNNMNATANDWTHIEPLLDDAMAALDETDRSAILLRYFENKSLREVGDALGASEDAAQKRVSRAVERLREFFSKRNVTIGAGGLVALISANAVQSAPIGLAAAISAAVVLAGTAVHTSTVIAATKAIAMTTLQKTLVAATVTASVAVFAGAGIYEARQVAQLREQNQTLQQQQQAPLDEQIQQLRLERDDATNRLAGLRADNARLKSNPNEMELLKLRGEVTLLRPYTNQLNGPTTQIALGWVAKKQKLQKLFAERPDQQIPELRILTDKDWLKLVIGQGPLDMNLDSEYDVKFAMSKVRSQATMNFAPTIVKALKKFVEANNGNYPTDPTQLKPYFDQPVEDALFERYRVLNNEEAESGWTADMALIEKKTLDKWLDSTVVIGPFGAATGSIFPRTVQAVMQAYRNANNGQRPDDLSKLKSYVTTPEQESALEGFIKTLKDAQAP